MREREIWGWEGGGRKGGGAKKRGWEGGGGRENESVKEIRIKESDRGEKERMREGGNKDLERHNRYT